jgi:toxin ParE1/3/4
VSRRIRRHHAVADDIVEQALYIAERSPASASRFLHNVETTLRFLLAFPGAGHLRDFESPALATVRSWPVKGFRNHLILYEVERDGVYVLTITHGARDLPRILADRI